MNKLVSEMQASATLALNQKAKQMVSDGLDVVNLTAGEPDLGTPKNIQKAAIDAIESGKHFYTASAGINELREAIAKTSSQFYGRTIESNQTIVCNGGKHALFNVFFSILEPNDEVIILKPYWVSYPAIVKLCKGVPVYVESSFEDSFKPSIKSIEKNISSKTKAIIINSPNNPSSQFFDKEYLVKITKLIKDKAPNAYIVTDDIYAKLIYDESAFYSLGMHEEISFDNLVIINGLSKTYSMTGWRVGWAITNTKLVQAMTKVQSQTTANVSSISQWAAVEALLGDQSKVNEMIRLFKNRRDACLELFKSLRGVKCIKPIGAFYFFIDVRVAIKNLSLKDDLALSNMLLDEHHLALVPGSAFGAPGFLRMSFASSQDDLREGISRLKKALA